MERYLEADLGSWIEIYSVRNEIGIAATSTGLPLEY